jgi:hypothetical protein
MQNRLGSIAMVVASLPVCLAFVVTTPLHMLAQGESKGMTPEGIVKMEMEQRVPKTK